VRYHPGLGGCASVPLGHARYASPSRRFAKNATISYDKHALGKVVRATGVKEFAAKIGMESPNLLRAIHPRHNPTQATINRILSPLGLKLSLAPIEKPKRSHAA